MNKNYFNKLWFSIFAFDNMRSKNNTTNQSQDNLVGDKLLDLLKIKITEFK